jgi:hypothetical protein
VILEGRRRPYGARPAPALTCRSAQKPAHGRHLIFALLGGGRRPSLEPD